MRTPESARYHAMILSCKYKHSNQSIPASKHCYHSYHKHDQTSLNSLQDLMEAIFEMVSSLQQGTQCRGGNTPRYRQAILHETQTNEHPCVVSVERMFLSLVAAPGQPGQPISQVISHTAQLATGCWAGNTSKWLFIVDTSFVFFPRYVFLLHLKWISLWLKRTLFKNLSETDF